MFQLNSTLYVVAWGLELALVGLFLLRKLYGRFPFFFAYLLCSSLGDILRVLIMSNSLGFYLLYWIVQAIYLLLTLLVIIEIFKPALGVLNRRFGWAVFLLPFGAIVLIDYLFWRPLHRGFGTGFPGLIGGNISAFELGVSCSAAIIFFAGLWLERRYDIWGQYALGVLGGFGLIGLGTVMAYFMRFWLWFGNWSKLFFEYAPSFAFFGATLMWFVIFLEKEKPDTPRETMDLEKLQQAMDAFQESVEDLRRKARRFGIRFRIRLA